MDQPKKLENNVSLSKKKLFNKIVSEQVFLPGCGKFGNMFSFTKRSDAWKCRICKVGLKRIEVLSHAATKSHEILVQKHKELFREYYESQAEKEKNKSKAREYTFQELLDSVKTSPLIGIEYILEIVHPKHKSYVCTLCSNMRCNPINHLLGYTHKMRYLKTHFKTAHRHFQTSKVKRISEEHKAALDKIAWAIELTYGRLKHNSVKSNIFKAKRGQSCKRWKKGKHFRETPGLTFEDIAVNELAKVSMPDNMVSSTQEDPSGMEYYEDESNERYGSYSDVDDFDDYEGFVEDYGGSNTYGEFVEEAESFKGEENEDYGTKIKTFHELAKDIDDVMHETLMKYKSNPEEHPLYNEEWNKFWKRRYMELGAEGKDVSTYDFKPEWKIFWDARMLELHVEELELKKSQLREMLGLPNEPIPVAEITREVVMNDNHNVRPEIPLRKRLRPPMNEDCLPEYPPCADLMPKRHRQNSPSQRTNPRVGSPPHQRNFPSRHRDSPSRCRQSPSLHKGPSSRHKDPPFDLRDSLSRRRDSPSHSRKSPSRSRYSPTRHIYSPTRRRDSPLDLRDSISHQKDSPSSRRRDSPFSRRDSPSFGRESSSHLRGSPSNRRESSRTRRDSPLSHRDSSSRHRESPVSHRDSSRSRRDSPSSHRDSSSRHRESRIYRGDSPSRRRYSPLRSRDSPLRHRRWSRSPRSNSTSTSRRRGNSRDEQRDASGDFEINLVSVLRPLVVLEDRLGPFMPKAIALLSSAMDMEKNRPISSGELLHDEANCEFFEDVKQRLVGQTYSDTKDRVKKDVFNSVIKNLDCIINLANKSRSRKKGAATRENELFVAGVGSVNRERISVQIVNTLLAQGRRDITQEELDYMVEELAKKESSMPFVIDKEGSREQGLNKSEEKRKMEMRKLKDSRIESLTDRHNNSEAPSSSKLSAYDNVDKRRPGFPNINNAPSNYRGLSSNSSGSNSFPNSGVAPLRRSTEESFLHSKEPLLKCPPLLTSPPYSKPQVFTETRKEPLLKSPPSLKPPISFGNRPDTNTNIRGRIPAPKNEIDDFQKRLSNYAVGQNDNRERFGNINSNRDRGIGTNFVSNPSVGLPLRDDFRNASRSGYNQWDDTRYNKRP